MLTERTPARLATTGSSVGPQATPRTTPGRRLSPALLAAGLLAFLVLAMRPAAAVIGPYLVDPTPDGAAVRWITDSPTVGVVEYGTTSALGRSARETSPTRFHSVRLTGLPSSSAVFYRISGRTAAGPMYSFQTAPSRPEGFTFAVCGDTRSRHAEHRRVVSRIKAAAPRFLVHTGDLVADGSDMSQWHRFFQIAGPLIAEAPLVSVPGNHEGRSGNWERLASPNGRRSYCFRYGNCFFLCLDTDPEAVSDASWLSFVYNSLKAAQDASYRVVVIHRPPFTVMPKRIGSARDLREKLVPLLRRYGVNLVLCGHDHNYQHHVVDGIHYVVTGGGGAPLYSITQSGTALLRSTVQNEALKAGTRCELRTVKAVSVLHYVLVAVGASQMTVRAVDVDGRELDSFTIPKRQAGRPETRSGRGGAFAPPQPAIAHLGTASRPRQRLISTEACSARSSPSLSQVSRPPTPPWSTAWRRCWPRSGERFG